MLYHIVANPYHKRLIMNSTATPSAERSLPLLFLFAGTLFVSASIMFVVQPLFGKLLLPLLGGTPAVWNTCMVFYQIILFLGYLYAHYLSSQQTLQKQVYIHALIMLISFIALPVALPENIAPPTESNPTFWLIWTLFIAIGLPFFVVSTTAPLLQKWFSHIGHHNSHDPYFLYAASNAGSLLSLLSYPFIIEPLLGLSEQRTLWSIAYFLLALLIGVCGFVLWRCRKNTEADIPKQATDEAPPLDWQTRVHWLLLAFVPSSLLLGLTNFISTDIASAPLLWIIPLTLYLFSFVLVFSRWSQHIHPLMLQLQPILLLPFLAFSFIEPAAISYEINLLFHLLAFFVAIMVCHGELANQRPHTHHLTEFYLIMSFAGMLGGMFNTFVAPFIFNAVYEYPLMIVAALLLRPCRYDRDALLQLILPVILLLIGGSIWIFSETLNQHLYSISIILTLLAGVCYAFRQHALTLGLVAGLILFFSQGMHGLLSNTLFQERSFFGVLAVKQSLLTDEQQRPEKYHELFHGTTKHGAQRLKPQHLTTPLSYYSRPGPMGQLFKVFDHENAQWQVGSVGLGAGALACYAKAQQHWRFYEIDPLVVDIAKDTQYFNYLSRCAKNSEMIIGDARLSLQHEADNSFDLLIMDAFSSDSVPTHLLTQEAMHLYFAKLKPNGLLAFHITNRHLELKKVLADHAVQLKLEALIQEFKPQNPAPLVVATDWVVLSKDAQQLARLQKSRRGNWQKMPLYFDIKPWTDDFTNIIGIWK